MKKTQQPSEHLSLTKGELVEFRATENSTPSIYKVVSRIYDPKCKPWMLVDEKGMNWYAYDSQLTKREPTDVSENEKHFLQLLVWGALHEVVDVNRIPVLHLASALSKKGLIRWNHHQFELTFIGTEFINL